MWCYEYMNNFNPVKTISHFIIYGFQFYLPVLVSIKMRIPFRPTKYNYTVVDYLGDSCPQCRPTVCVVATSVQEDWQSKQ